MADFIETLLKMDITTEVVTDQSALLIDVIYGLTGFGCTMSVFKELIMESAEVYGCAGDRNQAKIVFNVAVDMVRLCTSPSKRIKILGSQK